MKTRLFALLIVAALLLPVLAGCGDDPTKEVGVRGASVVSLQHQVSPTPQTKQPQEAVLTQEEAENIALQHAALTREQATRLHTEYDADDPVPNYDIQFYAEEWEYDYEINAQTGAIMSWDKEYDGVPQQPAQPEPTQPAAAQSLTQEEAEAIALAHAGFTREQASYLHTEYDRDDYVPNYDVEFYAGDYEYDYEINAQTGAIIQWHREYEGKPQQSAQPAPTEPVAAEPAPTRLSEDEVIAIALRHVGLSRDQVSRLKIEYDVDDGVPQYDIEFHAGSWEYEFEIHAESGKILSFEKDD